MGGASQGLLTTVLEPVSSAATPLGAGTFMFPSPSPDTQVLGWDPGSGVLTGPSGDSGGG